MANRPVKRRVVIVYEGRDPADTPDLLRRVADDLRPSEVEIRVRAAPDDPPTLPNEQLETRARERAAEALDRRDERVRSEGAGAAAEPEVRRSADVTATKGWMSRAVAAGWRFALKVLPVAERVAKVYKDLGG